MMCSCGAHYRWMTINGAHRRADTLRCKVCDESTTRLSGPALRVAEVLDSIGTRYAYEARPLGAATGPVDFYFPELRLAVEVDGQQHYEGSMHGESFQKLQLRDGQKVEKLWEAGISVLRIPYFCLVYFYPQVLDAIKERQQHPHARFVLLCCPPVATTGFIERRGDKLKSWLECIREQRQKLMDTHAASPAAAWWPCSQPQPTRPGTLRTSAQLPAHWCNRGAQNLLAPGLAAG